MKKLERHRQKKETESDGIMRKSEKARARQKGRKKS